MSTEPSCRAGPPDTALAAFAALPVGRYRLTFAPRTATRWSPATPAWRGALGHALRGSAALPLFFPAARAGRGAVSGHGVIGLAVAPFVLRSPAPWLVELHLLGAGLAWREDVLRAFGAAAEHGLGSRRCTATLTAVQQEMQLGTGTWAEPVETPQSVARLPPPAQRLRLHFLTPLRLRRRNRNLTPESLAFVDFLAALARRLSALLASAGLPVPPLDFAALARTARTVRWQQPQLRWRELAHHSTRQQATMSLGGVIGTAIVEGEFVRRCWPLLWMGQWTHVGKAASMGLGACALEALD